MTDTVRVVPDVVPRDGVPPGPRLPRAVQTAIMLRYWPGFLRAAGRRYGPIFTVDTTLTGKFVYLVDPADVRTVFSGDPEVLRAGELNAAFLSGVLGDTSVLVVDGATHRDRRRLMLPPFHRDAVRRQAGEMAEITAANVAGWPLGRTFPVAPRMAQITLEVILRTVIGTRDPERLTALRAALPPVVNMGTMAMLAMINPKLLEKRPWRYVKRRIAAADALIYAEIADRRADPDLAERTDVLAMLVRAAGDDTAEGGRHMSDVELRDQLMTLLFAGHETTATGLSWALERLTRHPAELNRAIAAADASAAGDPAGDEYLDAVAKEILRVRPVVFDVGRVLHAPLEVGGWRLPAGVTVAPGIGLVHADPDVYPDPERFDPERMLGPVTPDGSPRGLPPLSPSTWLPFGGGGRRCLGATFAQVEMRVVLREVLRRVRPETTAARGEKQRVKHVTLVPHRGARIRVRPRT
jgi:cytochrome P450 family 135